MNEYRSVNKEVKQENGTWAVESVQVPLTPEEITKRDRELKEQELSKCILYLEDTRWIYDKMNDGELTRAQIADKHPDIMSKRIETRARMQVLQAELK